MQDPSLGAFTSWGHEVILILVAVSNVTSVSLFLQLTTLEIAAHRGCGGGGCPPKSKTTQSSVCRSAHWTITSPQATRRASARDRQHSLFLPVELLFGAFPTGNEIHLSTAISTPWWIYCKSISSSRALHETYEVSLRAEVAPSAPTEHKRALMSRQGDTLTSQGHFPTEGPDRKNSSPPLGILVAKNKRGYNEQYEGYKGGTLHSFRNGGRLDLTYPNSFIDCSFPHLCFTRVTNWIRYLSKAAVRGRRVLFLPGFSTSFLECLLFRFLTRSGSPRARYRWH